MALIRIENIDEHSAWALWKIEESYDKLKQLYSEAIGDSDELVSISHAEKKVEWLAGRLSAKALVDRLHKDFNGIYKDNHGKPYLHGLDYPISLANSYPYAGAIIHLHQQVGIDIEEPKETLRRVQQKFLNQSELEHAENDLTKLCLYWCAKESLYKIYGKKKLSFRQNIFIDHFNLPTEEITGYIDIDGKKSYYRLFYKCLNNYYMVYGF